MVLFQARITNTSDQFLCFSVAAALVYQGIHGSFCHEKQMKYKSLISGRLPVWPCFFMGKGCTKWRKAWPWQLHFDAKSCNFPTEARLEPIFHLIFWSNFSMKEDGLPKLAIREIAKSACLLSL